MHYCPDCGHACYCHGDIDDTVVELQAYSDARCRCPFDNVDGCGVECAEENYEPFDADEPPAPLAPGDSAKAVG